MRHHPVACKDIPDRPILEFLAKHQGETCHWHGLNGTYASSSVQNAMPSGLPDRLIVKKMARLINRGLVEGCGCGCRGDYEITDKGLAEIGWTGEVRPLVDGRPR